LHPRAPFYPGETLLLLLSVNNGVITAENRIIFVYILIRLKVWGNQYDRQCARNAGTCHQNLKKKHFKNFPTLIVDRTACHTTRDVFV